MKSIIQETKECFICKTTHGLHEHHVYGGSNRNKSETYGMKVYLCGFHHNLGGKNSVHYNAEMNNWLKAYCQTVFEDTYKDKDFIKEFGRNYK